MTDEIFDAGLEEINCSEYTLYYHPQMLSILRAINNQLKSYEFTVLFNALIHGDHAIVLPEYYIPLQQVSYGSVEYEEDISMYIPQYPCHVHKHPYYSNATFSSADENNTCKNFPITMLINEYCKVTDAQITFSCEDKLFIIKPASIEPYIPESHVDIQGIENIKKYEYKYTYTTPMYPYGSAFSKLYNPRRWRK